MTRSSRSSSPRVRVAVDGPAGVGKTTTARALAGELGFLYVDTGAMYRALAVHAARHGISPDDGEATTALARACRVDLAPDPEGGIRVSIGDADLTDAIRSDAASDGASRISIHPGVRECLVGWQRAMASRGGVVMEGRDIGTVVLPDAEAKIFLTASTEERARRRFEELGRAGRRPSFEAVLRDIRERDARDQGRETSPLRPAPDAVVVDCTALGLADQIAAVRRVVDALVAMKGDRPR